MVSLKWALRLSLIVYAGYLVDSSYFSLLQTPLSRALLVAFLFSYTVWFYRRETSAVAFLIFIVPLSAVFPRLFAIDLPPFHVFFTSAFILAFAVSPLIGLVRGWFATEPSSGGSQNAGSSMPEVLTRPRLLFTVFAGAWVAFCLISFVFVCLRYMNLYPFSGDPFYDYVITRLGQRASEGMLHARWTLASYANSAVFLIYILSSRRIGGPIPSSYLKWLFASYSCVGVVAWFQHHYALGFLNAGGIWQRAGRLNATFDDPNALASSLILLFPLAILGTLYLTGSGRVLAFSATVSSFYLLYVAASRTAFAGLVLGLVLIAFFLGWRALRMRHYALLGSLVVLAIVIVIGSVVLLEKGPRDVLVLARAGEMWDYLKHNWNQGTLFSGIGKVAYSRNYWWPSALRMVKEDPLTGVGIGAFAFETVNQGAPFDTAGNQYLQLLAEYGSWGLLFIVGFAFAITYYLGRVARQETRGSLRDYLWVTALGASLVSFAISLHFGSHLVFNQVGFVFGLVLGCLVRVPCKSNPVKQDNSWKGSTAVAAAAAGLFFIAQLTTLSYSPPLEFRKELVGRDQPVFGYRREKWADRFEFRWLKSVNWRRIQLDRPELRYELYTANPEARSAGVTVCFFIDDRLLKTVKLTDTNWGTHCIDIPKDMVGKTAVLKVTVDRTWHPSGDRRDLGIALRELDVAAAN